MASTIVKSIERQILPANARPTHYDLRLEPNFTTCKIDGSVSIALDILESSKSITLNVVDLDIENISLKCGEIQQSPTSTSLDEKKQTLKVQFETEIPKGSNATLYFKFQAVLNDKGIGFYRSSYTDNNGDKKYIAVSQLAVADARRVFPCFDEPALKATFNIALVAHKDHTCLSNMNALSEEILGDNRKLLRFAKTPPMSTYILAFAIGDLEYIETTAFRIPIRVYTTPGLSGTGQFALNLAAKTLKFYEESFDSPFPLPKMDMIAVPDAFGAMENWGLVTYKQSLLLFDEKTSGVEDKKRVAYVVNHELAHQWFGNLVTMEFWDGLWLNEGFATWMGWHATDHFFPEWNVWQDFVTRELQQALSLDSLRSSHPVEVPVIDVDDINQIFDAISYQKGSCVIRMIATSLGEELLLKGIQDYLKKHALKNTGTSDLWHSLSAVSGRDMTKEMSVWTKKVGYPVLTVVESDNKIHIRQDRFLQSRDASEAENETLYVLSLGLITTKGPGKNIVLETRSVEIELEDLNFFKLNHKHSGFYRTLYTPERMAKLGQSMSKGLLSVEDRIGIIADASALATSGYQKTSALLGLLSNLKNEESPFVWMEINSSLTKISDAFKFEDNSLLKALRNFKRDLIAPQAKTLGWDFSAKGEDVSLVKHKAEMFEAAVDSRDPIIVQAALKMFAAFSAGDSDAVNPNIRNGVYAAAMRQSDDSKAYESLLSFARGTTAADEYEDAMRGLGNTRDSILMKSLLDLILTDEIKPQNFYMPLLTLRTDAIGSEALWIWAQSKWEDIEIKLTASLAIFGIIVGIMIRGLSSQKYLGEIEEFFKKKDTSKYDKQLALVLDSMKANVAWVDRDRDDLSEWLKENGYYGSD